jgi:hypothetical protein
MNSPSRYTTLFRYVLARAREASTWRGLILLVTGSWGVTHLDQVEAIVPLGMALAGLVGILFPDLAPGTANRRITDPGQPEGALPSPSATNPYWDGTR